MRSADIRHGFVNRVVDGVDRDVICLSDFRIAKAQEKFLVQQFPLFFRQLIHGHPYFLIGQMHFLGGDKHLFHRRKRSEVCNIFQTERFIKLNPGFAVKFSEENRQDIIVVVFDGRQPLAVFP